MVVGLGGEKDHTIYKEYEKNEVLLNEQKMQTVLNSLRLC